MGNNPDVWSRVKAAIERVAARENSSAPREMRPSNEEIWQMYCKGYSRARIAREFRIPYPTIYQLVARMERKRRKDGGDGSQHF